MAGITLQIAESKLALWLAAEETITLGQSLAHKGNMLTRANLKDVRDQITYWNSHVERLTPGADLNRCNRVQRIILHG